MAGGKSAKLYLKIFFFAFVIALKTLLHMYHLAIV